MHKFRSSVSVQEIAIAFSIYLTLLFIIFVLIQGIRFLVDVEVGSSVPRWQLGALSLVLTLIIGCAFSQAKRFPYQPSIEVGFGMAVGTSAALPDNPPLVAIAAIFSGGLIIADGFRRFYATEADG